MINLQSVPRNDEQRVRAAELEEMHARGEFLAWNWPATFLMGLWALANQVWWAFFRLMWTSRATYLFLALSVVLLFIAPKVSLLLILGYVPYVTGKYGNDLKYIMHGDRTPATFKRENLLVLVGLYLLAWALLGTSIVMSASPMPILAWAALLVCGVQLLRSNRSFLLPTCGVMLLLTLLSFWVISISYLMAESPTAQIRGSIVGDLVPKSARDLFTDVTNLASPFGVIAVLLYYNKLNPDDVPPQDDEQVAG